MGTCARESSRKQHSHEPLHQRFNFGAALWRCGVSGRKYGREQRVLSERPSCEHEYTVSEFCGGLRYGCTKSLGAHV